MTALPSKPSADRDLLDNPLRVMVVDDSAVVRGIIGKALQDDPEHEVASSVSNGQLAVGAAERGDYDVIILDIEMPVMDGLTALPLILKALPDVKVVVASTLTRLSILDIAKDMWPFLCVHVVVIFLITYFPVLTMTLPRLLGFGG